MIPAALPILLEAVVRALIVACVLGVILRLLRVKNVPAQKAAWGLVLLAAFAMPLMMRWEWLPCWAAVKLPTPFWARVSVPTPLPAPAQAIAPLPVIRQEANSQFVSTPHDRYDLPSGSEFPALQTSIDETSATPPGAAAPSVSKPAPKSLLPRIFTFAWIAYLAVGAALLLRLLFGLASSIRIWIGAKIVDIVHVPGAPVGVSVRSSRRVSSPVNIGSGILLPVDYASWDEEKLRVVLAHEHAHIQQRDYYLQLLAGIYAACTWFSPLGWWLKRKFAELGEAISDRAGLQAAASPSAYAELLLEFAALPRPTLSGVPMANSSILSQRIELLLNESSFHKTFAGGRRALIFLLVPAVLIAGVSLVRVKAAAAPTQPPAPQAAMVSAVQPPALPGVTIHAHLDSAQVAEARLGPLPQDPAPQSSSAPAPAEEPAHQAAPAPPAPPTPAASQQEPEPAPMPVPHVHVEVHVPPLPPMPNLDNLNIRISDFGFNGSPFAVVGDPGSKTHFSGAWDVDRNAEVEKARKIATGHFLLFRRDGKSYIIDDPAITKQIEDMERALQAQTDQMHALSEQMRDAVGPFRDQMHDQQQQERDAERKARETASEIPTPDLSKEMAELNAAVAALQAKQGGTITREQLNEIQKKIAEVQRRVIEAEVRVKVNVDFDRSKFNEARNKFSEQESQFGAQMGRLGAQIGQTARENNQKINSIVDESLKSGKARPVN